MVPFSHDERPAQMTGSTPNARSRTWTVWCAAGAFVAALPTVIWRIPLAAGHPLGTPASWRAVQDIPGSGSWYVLTLSMIQFIAATCSFALVVDTHRFTPRWAPEWVDRRLPAVVGLAGIFGAAALTAIVCMSVIAWDRVDPFAGEVYDAWAWLCAACYLCAVAWPIFLAAAAVGCLRRIRRSG